MVNATTAEGNTPETILKKAIALHADCDAILIPDGVTVRLEAHQVVYVMQILGGHFTVQSEGRLYRIGGQDAAVLGVDPTLVWPPVCVEAPAGGYPTPAALEMRVWDVLRTCYDPEIPVNVVDLGLVYACMVDRTDLPAGYRVVVQMTLTAPGCGMGPVLMEEMKTKIQHIPGVQEADVQLVFDPPWNQSLMTEAARLQLGLI